jgi:hypothetical protein
MQIDKDTIVNFLRERGDKDKAEQAVKDLPKKKYAGLLDKFGVDPKSCSPSSVSATNSVASAKNWVFELEDCCPPCRVHKGRSAHA